MRYRHLHTYILIGAFLAIPLAASAHVTGASFEKLVGDHTVDVGYDSVNPIAGDRLVLDFNLKNKDATPELFDYVWVRITSGEDTILAAGIYRPDFGPTSLLFVIPENMAGPITINTRFQKGEDALAEASFELLVLKAGSGFPLVPSLAAVAGLVIGGIGVFLLRRFKLIPMV